MTYAVIFRSTRALDDGVEYDHWSAITDRDVRLVEGYISHYGFREPDTRRGVTITFFDSLDSIKKWRQQSDHLIAQDLGREKFYQDYEVQVTEVLREYKWERP
jgi:heme-degrading monooxygenase HmoA